MTNRTVSDEVHRDVEREARERVEQGSLSFEVVSRPVVRNDKVEYIVDLREAVGWPGRGLMHRAIELNIQAVPTPLGRKALRLLNAIDGVEAGIESDTENRSTSRVVILVDKNANILQQPDEAVSVAHGLPERICVALEKCLLTNGRLCGSSA